MMPASCWDGVKNGAEINVDCGGGACPGCADGQGCAEGPRDCASGHCSAKTQTCIFTPALDSVADGGGPARVLQFGHGFFADRFEVDDFLFEPCGYSMNGILKI